MTVELRGTFVLGLLVISIGTLARADDDKSVSLRRASELQKKLSQPVTTPTFEANTPLREAIGFLRESNGLTVLIDTQAFKDDLQINEIESQPVVLPKMVGVPLRIVLQQLAKQTQAAVIVESGMVWIVPQVRAKERVLRQMVDMEFNNVPVRKVLDDLAAETNVTLLFDATRAGDAAKVPITAKLRGVGLEESVRTLADMAGLKSILIGDIFYVTTEVHASELAEEQKEREREQRALQAEKENKEREQEQRTLQAEKESKEREDAKKKAK